MYDSTSHMQPAADDDHLWIVHDCVPLKIAVSERVPVVLGVIAFELLELRQAVFPQPFLAFGLITVSSGL